jgi:hypothetical protein
MFLAIARHRVTEGTKDAQRTEIKTLLVFEIGCGKAAFDKSKSCAAGE